jgi:translation initiation factor 1
MLAAAVASRGGEVSRDPNARLVYSTGGEVEARRQAEPQRADGSRIRIRIERRASDRVVTLVTGLPGTDAEIADLARALKSACSTGGTVKDGTLELQGDHRDKVETTLRARGLESKRAGG